MQCLPYWVKLIPGSRRELLDLNKYLFQQLRNFAVLSVVWNHICRSALDNGLLWKCSFIQLFHAHKWLYKRGMKSSVHIPFKPYTQINLNTNPAWCPCRHKWKGFQSIIHKHQHGTKYLIVQHFHQIGKFKQTLCAQLRLGPASWL